jgi:beta-lactamase regulating signal transducer with metallopeptidase domain
MGNFLIVLLRRSVSMSLITLVYAAIMPVLSKRYAAKWRYMGWLAVAAGWIFPLCPVPRPRIDLSFLLPRITPAAPRVWPVVKALSSMAGTGGIGNTQAAFSVWPALAVMWMCGAAGVIAYHALRHGRFVKTVRRWSEPVSDPEILKVWDGLKREMGIKAEPGLKVCRCVTSPMLTGFFRPLILLPPGGIANGGLSLILRHELIHLRRGDLWHKALVLTATALHWFNPVVYFMAKAAAAQCEISCDALVLQDADFERRRQYGETIIGIVKNGAKPRTELVTNFYGGKRAMKSRIFSIMDTKRKKAGLMVFCITLAAIITVSTVSAGPAADNGIAYRSVIGTTGSISTDGGQTWMDEEEYHRLYPVPGIVWWTYDEYKEIVAEKRETLPALIGETYRYYDKNGVLHREVLTREKVDEFIRIYEQNLEGIKNGARLSKSVEGYDGTVGFGINISGPPSVGHAAEFSFENGDTKHFGLYATKEELFAVVKAFCDEQVRAGNMTRQKADEILSEFR